MFKQIFVATAVCALIGGCCCSASAAEHVTKAGKVNVAFDSGSVAITLNGNTEKTAIPEGVKSTAIGEVIVADLNFDGKDDLAVQVGVNGLNKVYLIFVSDQTGKFIMSDTVEFASMRLNSENGGRRLYFTVVESDKVSNVVEYGWHKGKLAKLVSHKQTKE